ncbi:unnamed protein product [Closterium sp. NIES-64]|nr:unnamed protein product [Closterium sp. NIES-64]
MLRYTDSCKPLPLAAVLSFSLCCAAGGAVRRELLDASDGLLSQTVTTRGSTTGSSGGGSTVSPDEALVIGDVSTVPDSRNSSTGSSSGSVSMGSTGNAGGTGGSIIVSGGGSSISGGSTASSSTGSGTTGISSTGAAPLRAAPLRAAPLRAALGVPESQTAGAKRSRSTVSSSALCMCPRLPDEDRASSVLSSQTNTRAKFNVDVNITSTQQRALFTFTVKAVSKTRAPVFSNSSYHTNTGQLVATFACVPKPTTTLGTYRCTTSSLANITVPFRPVNRPKALVDAGFFSNPTAFYSTIKVNGIRLRGSITASVANL